MELTPWEELVILHLRHNDFGLARHEIAIFEEEKRVFDKQQSDDDGIVLFCTGCGGYEWHTHGEQQKFCNDCLEETPTPPTSE